MAMSSLSRVGALPRLMSGQSSMIYRSVPMATSAHDQMKQFWEKNQRLGRPSSPWMIYKPHLPMLTSLTHRVTGIAMGVSLYSLSIGLLVAPGDFTSYVEFIKELHINPALMFSAKAIVAFPVVYHYINGMRHLSWDMGKGYELATQYKTGWTIVSVAITISLLLAAQSYF